MKYLFFLLLSVGASVSLSAQTDAKRARMYFMNGEFEKAATLYERLYEANMSSSYYFNQYFTTLLNLPDYNKAEHVIRKRLRKFPQETYLLVKYGDLLTKNGKYDKGQKQYEKAIKELVADRSQIVRMANEFVDINAYESAIKTYKKGNKLLKEPNGFAYELASVYQRKGDRENMIRSYLSSLEFMPTRMTNIQSFFQRFLEDNDYKFLQKELYTRIQKNNKATVFPEMLIWVFIQEQNFVDALRQAKALDKRLQESGARIMELARTAIMEDDYDAGIEAYRYIIDEKGEDCPYYLDAKRHVLGAKRRKLASGLMTDKAEIQLLAKEYEAFLDEFGRNSQTTIMQQELAYLYAYYLRDLDHAILLLEEVLKYPMTHRMTLARVRLDLGDYYLMKNDVWEATLYYSQVDKAMKDAPQGELARFKNAKLSYYKGDFDWAKDQLDVLKESTSELVANDAIELSVFIADHYNLDTTGRPLALFAQADFYRFQQKNTQAIPYLDSILTDYKGHGLGDDVYLARAEMAIESDDYPSAVSWLARIPKEYKDGILVDNALFMQAEIYERHLNNPEKAKALYEQIIFEHDSSVFIVEARKRFRRLRGDALVP